MTENGAEKMAIFHSETVAVSALIEATGYNLPATGYQV